jgi:hypothetical protein
MDTTNWVTILNSIVKNLLNGNSSLFLSFGTAISGGLAVILIVRYGITTALSGRGFDFGDFFHEVILLVGLCLCILRGYSTPLPIFGGERFPDLIVKGPQQLADTLTLDTNQQLDTAFKSVLTANPAPENPLDLIGIIQYWIVRGFIESTRGLMFAVTAFGLVAQAVLVLLGPVCIPFLLFQPLSFLFWGWFRSLLQYSFYPLVCAAFSSIFSNLFINLIAANTNDTLNIGQSLAMIPFFFIIIFGMLAVPVVVSGLFSGSASGGTISRFFSS